MDDKTRAHILGESIAKLHFELKGYFVYTNSSGKAEFDLVISKDSFLYSVEVKSVSSIKQNTIGTYFEVQLKSVRSNTTSNTIKKFDNTRSDFLCIVDISSSKILVLDTSSIPNTCAMKVYTDRFTDIGQ